MSDYKNALDSLQVKHVQDFLIRTSKKLSDAGIDTVTIAKFVPASKRFLFTKKARFETITKAWPLGVLLLSTDNRLFATGETTRAVAPGYPGHTSTERERRREYNKVAFNSGFEVGEVIYFECDPLELTSGEHSEVKHPLVLDVDTLKVLWNRSATASTAIKFENYVNEQVGLAVENKARQS